MQSEQKLFKRLPLKKTTLFFPNKNVFTYFGVGVFWPRPYS